MALLNFLPALSYSLGRSDVTISYAIEVRPTLEQHMNILMQLPNFLTLTKTYRAIAPLLGPTAVEQDLSAFDRCKCSSTVLHARLWANRPQVLTLKTGTQYIQAQVEVSPARAHVRRVVAELQQISGTPTVIQAVELPFQSFMDIHMTIDVDEDDLQTFDYNLFKTTPRRPCVNMYSFMSTLFSLNYLLVVRFEMEGWTAQPAPVVAEIPVTMAEVEERVECLKTQAAARAAERQVEHESTTNA
jgi:hypothetical protein